MTAAVTIILEPRTDVLAVPATAVSRETLGALRHGNGEGLACPEDGSDRLEPGWMDRRLLMVSPRVSESYFRSDEEKNDGKGR